MKRFLSIVCLGGAVLMASAQQIAIPFNGLITDMMGTPIKGARVWVVKNMYSKSDKSGRFGLTNVQASDTIHVKYNKKIYDIPVNGRKSIRIHLGDQLKAQEDEAIANVGYAYVKRREKTIPSSGVTGEMLVRTGQTNILKALDGLVAGYNLVNGSPIIRGRSTINLNTEPLYVVDGVVVSNLDWVNIYDVDHVEVLKEASIYGSRGANGAILVTTRSGN